MTVGCRMIAEWLAESLALLLVVVAGAVSAVLVLARAKGEHSPFVRTIDLIPGPERSRIPFVGNFPCFFGKQSDGKCDSLPRLDPARNKRIPLAPSASVPTGS